MEHAKILIVEDDWTFAETTKQKLLRMEYIVSGIVTSGEEAIRNVRDNPPDLVLMDIVLTGEMDGIEAASQIKLISNIPVIYVTSYVNDEFLSRAKLTTPMGYICKPFETETLKAAVEIALYRRSTERMLQETAEEKAQLEAQNQQLQKVESLGRMARAISHHFNNQLQTVMGNLEMAMEDLPRSENQINILLIEAMQAARKAAVVSGKMLTYLGQTFGKHEPVDLSEACRQSLILLKAAAPKGMILRADLPSCGPVIRANTSQIQQVLINLITNAWEAAGENRDAIVLTVKTVSLTDIPALKRFPINWRPKEIVYACMEVADEGHGIPDRDIDKLFDPFFTTNFTGRGLGLSVVLGIVGAHGGGITVESKPCLGSVFRVFFPVSTEELPCQPDLPAMPGVLQTGRAEKFSKIEGSGTVLLVEDEEPVRNMARMMLTRLGYTVLEAMDGVEAVEIFKQHQDDIHYVLSDLTMPRMDGWETIAALRKLSPDIPVILSSGYDKAQVMAVMAGDHTELPQVFLGKPYKLKELSEAIRQVLGSN